MTYDEQEKLFARIKRRCLGQADEWCSGYLHGLLEESEDGRPLPDLDIRTRALEDVDDLYAWGYMAGFVTSFGSDFCNQWWGESFNSVGDFRWWAE